MSAAEAFVFGKLPAHGDFVSRGLAVAARAAWDGWAGPGLALARERLGSGFDAAHQAAPAWRFARLAGPVRPGDPEAAWLAGALAPSIDRVGRRFLIVVGAAAASMPPGLEATEFAAAMEDLIYQALAEDLSADAVFEAAAARLATTADGAPAEPSPAQAWVGEPADDGPRLADMFAPDALLRMLTATPIGTPP